MNLGYNNGINAYKNNSVNYASKEQLLLMLLEGAVKFAKRARLGIEEKNIKVAHENIIKTQNIFFELMATLDVDKAGVWGKELYRVYEFITRRLADANIKKSVEIMDEVLPLIEEVRDMWTEAHKISKQG